MATKWVYLGYETVLAFSEPVEPDIGPGFFYAVEGRFSFPSFTASGTFDLEPSVIAKMTFPKFTMSGEALLAVTTPMPVYGGYESVKVSGYLIEPKIYL